MIKLRRKKIGPGSPVFVIAEAGVNHNGDINIAKKLVDEAVKAGADAIKFQNFFADEIVRLNAPKAEYQNRNIGKKKSQYQMLKELEISAEETKTIKKYCDQKKIVFLSTPYDFKSFNILKKLNVAVYKLASIDIVFHPLIKMVARTGKPLILSTGMATQNELNQAVRVFKDSAGKINNLVILKCNTNYPAHPEDQNLLAMFKLKKLTPNVGFSDHTLGYEASIVAVALGANVIEKHFTLNNNMIGPDHRSSLNPNDFCDFVRSIRKAELVMGSAEIRPTGGEIKNMKGMRRSICAKSNILKGTLVTEEMLTYKRPGDGLSPAFENIKRITGKKAKHDIKADDNITFSNIF